MILFQNVSLSLGKSTTRFAGSPFFRRKVTIFIGRETWLKHERQTVRMVIAETFHNSSAPFPPKFKEEWLERHEQHDALRRQDTARTREAMYCPWKTSVAGEIEFFSLFEGELGGSRHEAFAVRRNG